MRGLGWGRGKEMVRATKRIECGASKRVGMGRGTVRALKCKS